MESDYVIGRPSQFPKHWIRPPPTRKHQDLIITRDFGGSFIAQRDKDAVGWHLTAQIEFAVSLEFFLQDAVLQRPNK